MIKMWRGVHTFRSLDLGLAKFTQGERPKRRMRVMVML
jgi:hypothetical protein